MHLCEDFTLICLESVSWVLKCILCLTWQVTPLSFPQPIARGAESCIALHQMQVSEETRILRQVRTHLGTEPPVRDCKGIKYQVGASSPQICV